VVWLISILLFGVLQGLTEFLPVSSSGHLTIFQYFASSLEESLTLNVAVHLGTLCTVLIYYHKDLLAMMRGTLRREAEHLQMVLLLAVATLPTAVIGIGMKKLAPWILTSPLVAGASLLLTAGTLLLSDRLSQLGSQPRGFGISWRQALVIGLVQGVAVLPGISRSGSTIVAGLFLGMAPVNAARFSFLLSIPAIAGAGLLEFLGAEESLNWSEMGLAALVSFLTGLAAIHWMVRLVINRRLGLFAYYLIPASLIFLGLYSFDLGRDLL
jgi:undecaprenyl-diphosphatase